MKFHEEYQVYYMGYGDPYVFTEQKRDYGLIAPRAQGKVVLDFGAHCGFFNVFVSRHFPPAKIISVEPDPRPQPALKKNARKDSIVIEAAVVNKDYPGSTIPLYLGGKQSSRTTTIPVVRREVVDVSVVKFQDLVKKHRVNFIKCDCEGGEYDLDWSNLPPSVESIALEYHFKRVGWLQKMRIVDQALLNQGFTHAYSPRYNSYSETSKGMYIR